MPLNINTIRNYPVKCFKMNRHLILVWLLISSAVNSAGQSPFMRQHNLFRGKEEYTVNTIYQDKRGLIWFGTDRGLFRFDGISNTMFTISEGISNNSVTSLHASGNNILWIGHRNGEITLYDGNTFSKFLPEETLGKVPVTDIVSDKDEVIWYSTLGEGVFRYDGKYLSNLSTDDGLSDNYVYDIEIDSAGVIWLATDNGITRYLDGKCEVISMKDGLSDNIVRVLRSSGDGRLWIGTEEKGITIYDTERKEFMSFGQWDLGPVTGLTITIGKNVWVTTQLNGLFHINILPDQKIRTRKVINTSGSSFSGITSLLKDSEENIWIGGKRFVTQILPPVFEFLNKSNGTPFEMSYSLVIDNSDRLWVCSETGLYTGSSDISGQYSWTNISRVLNLGSTNFISLYYDSRQQIWAGTYGQGVYRIDPSNMNFIRFTTNDGLSDNNVISISGDDNRVWFSTLGGGVSCFDLASSDFKSFNDPDLRNSYVYSTGTDRSGRTWIAGSLRNPSYIFRDSLHFLSQPALERIPNLYSIAFDSSGNTWFNTGDDGLIKIDGDSLKLTGSREGISMKKIQSIAFDKHKNLLIISNYGLQFYRPGAGVFHEMGENSILAYLYPILNSVYSDRAGHIWIGTETGIIKYNPDYLQLINLKPRIFISAKSLFSNPISGSRSKFRYNQNNFTFGYTGIWFSNPEALKYRYMLKGYDLKWNYTSGSQVRTYSKLPPGEYAFTAEVSLDEKNWYSSDDSVYSFTISPPFWLRWWFITYMILLALLGIYYYIKLRLKKLERDKARLETEVQKRTEEVRKQNEELEAQKREIEKQRDLAEEQRDKIEAQKEEIQSSIRYAQRIQAATLPPKTHLDAILREYFILNKPRDIVSGDFFWVARSNDNLFFAVADCTGHGVPGSFMSMLGLSGLNDIVKSLKTCTASEVLDQLRRRIQEALHQDEKRETVTHDGMDISLCILETNTGMLQFAAAHNPMYIIRNNEIITVPADKIDISSTSLEKIEFTNHTIRCFKDDLLYLFTDGYADQFGGPRARKYKYQRFRDFLLSISQEPMQRQKEMLDREIESWRGNLSQVDDILVLGIKITPGRIT
jgi:ligand-binding sensor domain-containing protein/serine phosphatase RsbU (regulator of sigma subunit)